MTAGEMQALVVPVSARADSEPLKLSVRPGTLVVWVNQSGNDIRVMFPDRTVTIACLSPVNFELTAEGFFLSGRLPPGAVASLCCVQPGSYAFSIERAAAGSPVQADGFLPAGTVTVR